MLPFTSTQACQVKVYRLSAYMQSTSTRPSKEDNSSCLVVVLGQEGSSIRLVMTVRDRGLNLAIAARLLPLSK